MNEKEFSITDFKINFSCDVQRQISETEVSNSFRGSSSSIELIVPMFLFLVSHGV